MKMKALCSSETMETTQQNILHLKNGGITFLRKVGSQPPHYNLYLSCRISGSHTGGYKEFYILGYNVM
jgi:hypothetical protein